MNAIGFFMEDPAHTYKILLRSVNFFSYYFITICLEGLKQKSKIL